MYGSCQFCAPWFELPRQPTEYLGLHVCHHAQHVSVMAITSPNRRLQMHKHVNHTVPSPASSVTMVNVAVLLATPYTRPGPYAETLPLLG